MIIYVLILLIFIIYNLNCNKIKENGPFRAIAGGIANIGNKISVNKLSTKLTKGCSRNKKSCTAGVIGVATLTATGINSAVTGENFKDSLKSTTTFMREEMLEPTAKVGAEIASVGVAVGAEMATTVIKTAVNSSGGLFSEISKGAGSIFDGLGIGGIFDMFGNFGMIIGGLIIFYIFIQLTSTSENRADQVLY